MCACVEGERLTTEAFWRIKFCVCVLRRELLIVNVKLGPLCAVEAAYCLLCFLVKRILYQNFGRISFHLNQVVIVK